MDTGANGPPDIVARLLGDVWPVLEKLRCRASPWTTSVPLRSKMPARALPVPTTIPYADEMISIHVIVGSSRFAGARIPPDGPPACEVRGHTASRSAPAQIDAALQLLTAQIPPTSISAGARLPLHGDLRGATGGFAHGHAGGHDADRAHRLMGRGDAPAGDDQVLNLLRHERAIGDVVAIAAPDQRAAVVRRAMDVDGIARDRDGIVEVPAAQHVILRHHVLADDAPRLADAEERRRLGEVRLLEARHVVHQIGDDVVDLRGALRSRPW